MESIPTRIPANLCAAADRLKRPGQSRTGVLIEALMIGLDVMIKSPLDSRDRPVAPVAPTQDAV